MMRVLAQVFPVDPAAQTLLDATKADLVAWGVAFLGVALVLYAYHRIASLMETKREAELNRIFEEKGW